MNLKQAEAILREQLNAKQPAYSYLQQAMRDIKGHVPFVGQRERIEELLIRMRGYLAYHRRDKKARLLIQEIDEYLLAQ